MSRVFWLAILIGGFQASGCVAVKTAGAAASVGVSAASTAAKAGVGVAKTGVDVVTPDGTKSDEDDQAKNNN